MDDSSDHSRFYQSTIENVEIIYESITELFGEDSSEDGLFSVRASTLHQFSILASAYHQLNTIDYLENSEAIHSKFRDEINIANYRTRDYEHRSIRQVRKNVKKLEDYLDTISELTTKVSDLKRITKEYVSHLENNYYENIINSVVFYLQEINSRILEPAAAIIEAEIIGSSKLVNLIDSQQEEIDKIGSEAIARMCEVMSWGLETPPGWKSIQSDTNELTGDLEKKIGSLKAITTYYQPS